MIIHKILIYHYNVLKYKLPTIWKQSEKPWQLTLVQCQRYWRQWTYIEQVYHKGLGCISLIKFNGISYVVLVQVKVKFYSNCECWFCKYFNRCMHTMLCLAISLLCWDASMHIFILHVNIICMFRWIQSDKVYQVWIVSLWVSREAFSCQTSI